MSETTTRAYELGFILAPSVAETEVAAQVGTLKAIIEKGEGTVAAEGSPEFIDLAYTMEKDVASKKMKYSQGYFGWIKFEAAPESIEGMKKSLDLIPELVRFLLVKTDLANTVVFKKPKVEAVRGPVSEGDEFADLASTTDEDMKEDHEMLPDVTGDILEETGVQAPLEAQETEE